MELTILMPCLNEEETIASCINEAKAFLDTRTLSAEIFVVDNGSTDRSPEIAKELGARVVICMEPGYGNALRCGLSNAQGKYIIYADCDMSYNFFDCGLIYDELKSGADFVVGNRFNPWPSSDAMSLSHRIGVPVLSLIGRIRYGISIKDFHCGIRGISKEASSRLAFKSTGMEFATEIIALAKLGDLKISEVPVTLRPDGRNTPSHLRTVRDGFRHLFFMLKRS